MSARRERGAPRAHSTARARARTQLLRADAGCARPGSDGAWTDACTLASMSTTIDESRTAVTLINTFDVEPHKQDELVELLERAAVEVFQYLDGFISSNIHRGLDGKHVAAYAQWARREDTSPSLAAHSPW